MVTAYLTSPEELAALQGYEATRQAVVAGIAE